MTLRGVKIAGNLDEELDDEYRYRGSRMVTGRCMSLPLLDRSTVQSAELQST